jgi:uncharacterized protein (TIGR00661 family)
MPDHPQRPSARAPHRDGLDPSQLRTVDGGARTPVAARGELARTSPLDRADTRAGGRPWRVGADAPTRARIAYGLAAVGYGHAVRAQVVTAALRAQGHEVQLYSAGVARRFLERAGMDVKPIACPIFEHRDDGSVSLSRSFLPGTDYLRKLPQLVGWLAQELEEQRADLVITDFEPALPRAAHRLGMRVVSLDSQHQFVHASFAGMPWRLRTYAAVVAQFTKFYVPRPDLSIISSFYPLQLRDGVLVGGLLRPSVLAARPSVGEHALVYVKPAMEAALLRVLPPATTVGLREYRVYGARANPPRDRDDLVFRPVADEAFVADLAAARAVIGTCGHQLPSEALYLGKPYFAIPEPGQDEQSVNGWQLERMGAGWSRPLKGLTGAMLRGFFAALGDFDMPDSDAVRGNERALAAIQTML